MSLLDCEMTICEITHDYCFYQAFSNSTALVRAPRLTATKLSKNCYQSMFYGCCNLTATPSLPATDLKEYCYNSMFYGCTSLKKAPLLQAEHLVQECYGQMFNGCSQLEFVEVGFTNWGNNTTDSWLDGTAAEGKLRHFSGLDVSQKTVDRIPSSWTTEEKKDYLCFTAWKDNSTVKLPASPSAEQINFEFSTDGIEWYSYKLGDTLYLPNAGDAVYFRSGDENPHTMFSTNIAANYHYQFNMTGKIAASGNIMSLLDKYVMSNSINLLQGNTFYKLFCNCTALMTSPKLPLMRLSFQCYSYMFSGCTSLTRAPELPATTLTSNCYSSMFSGCTSLTQAPALPAETLAINCYYSMFSGCTSLARAPELPATTLADRCYNGESPANGMFSGCISLTAAPDLPAAWLPATHCYGYIFYGCKSLTTGPVLSCLSSNNANCTANMFSQCVNLSSITLAEAESSTQLKWNSNAFTDVGTYDGKIFAKQSFIDSLSGAMLPGTPTTWTIEAISEN